MKRLVVTSGLVAWLALTLAVGPARAQADPALAGYYAGPGGRVRQALLLAEQAGALRLVEAPAAAQVLVLDGQPVGELVAGQVRAGAGLVLFLGPEAHAGDLAALLGAPLTLAVASNPLSLTGAPGDGDPLNRDVIWNSSPQVRERAVVAGGGLQPLAAGFEDGSLVLGTARVGAGRVFLFAPYLDGTNPQVQDWAYFNYLVYHLVARAGGLAPLSFADYPGSPVPHRLEQAVLLGVLVAMTGTTVAAFVLVRRYSLRHPELLDGLVADRAAFAVREAATPWEAVGFHRPLAGFLVALLTGLVLFIPLIIYQNLVLPAYILPSAQALGIWGRVVQFFGLAWQFFDFGTSVAFIKYLSQHRVHDPRRGIQYGQLFVWWQALSGAVQVALVVLLASVFAPRTAYALYAWSVIIHAFIQLPGLFQVFRHALLGWQRQDYGQLLEIMLSGVLPMAVQPVFVGLMVAWGRQHPVFGGPMGGLLGMGLAAYAAELLTFLFGWWLYQRIGYSAKVLFLAHFDREVIRTGFGFGVFEMLGSLAWAGGQAAEVWLTQARLINYAEIWGNWGLAQNFVFSYQVLQTLYNGAMPAISETISHGRVRISQYYAAQGYKYGGMLSAFIAAVLLAVADRFILGASGVEFARGAVYVIPLAVWGAIQYPSWVADNVQLACNRPYLKASLIFAEQMLRVALAFWLVARFQILGLIVAYFVGLLAKDLVAFLVNHRVCFPQRFYAWQSLAAPLLAGTTHYLLLRWVTGLLWRGDQVTSVLIFLIGILISFPVYVALYALFGGWDEGTLDELRLAAALTGWARPLAWVFWAGSALGARLSPLHNRFPITIRAEALAEARALTVEKVAL